MVKASIWRPLVARSPLAASCTCCRSFWRSRISSSMVSVPTIERSDPSSTFLTMESTCSGLASRNRSAALQQRLDVASDLERGHALHLHLDALAGHRVAKLHVDLARGQLELADAVEQGTHKRAATDHDLDALVTRDRQDLAALVANLGAARAGDDEGLVCPGDLVPAGHESDQQDEDDHARHREERNGRHETRHRILLLLWSLWWLLLRGWFRRQKPPSPRGPQGSRRRRWRSCCVSSRRS